jgi:hypothetical protein
VVRRYSNTGQLLRELQLDYDDKLFFDQESIVALDASNGTLLQLVIKNDGAVLVRWNF